MMREFNFESTPIVDIVNNIIVDSIMKRASDIHFDPHEKFLKIRIRVDGELRDYSIVDNEHKKNLISYSIFKLQYITCIYLWKLKL